MELTVLLRWNSNDIFMDSEDSQDNAWTHKQFLEPKGTQWTQKKKLEDTNAFSLGSFRGTF